MHVGHEGIYDAAEGCRRDESPRIAVGLQGGLDALELEDGDLAEGKVDVETERVEKGLWQEALPVEAEPLEGIARVLDDPRESVVVLERMRKDRLVGRHRDLQARRVLLHKKRDGDRRALVLQIYVNGVGNLL